MEFGYLKQIVEALIFASDVPLTESRIRNYVEELDGKQVKQIIDQLNQEYAETQRPFLVAKVAGGYQLVTRPQFSRWIKKLYKGRARMRLSQPALETLSIIAFKQPISRGEMAQIRGVNCDGVIKNLLERNLITISGRAKTVGRPLLYSTTPEFLRYFGINDVSDLPKPKEIEELLAEGEAASALSQSAVETVGIDSAKIEGAEA